MKEARSTEVRSPGRREFVKRSGAIAGAGAISSGTLLAASSDAWAQGLSTLTMAEGKALLQMCRDLYPHDQLSDEIYQKVVDGYDAAAAGDANMARTLSHGVRDLNAAAQSVAGADYVMVDSERMRVAALGRLESTPFFQTVRGSLITGIYNNPDVWPVFGYEGPSAHLGGYLKRGFDDIDWL